MPRNSLIDFTEEELEIINECRKNGDFENPLYKEYKETQKIQNELLKEMFSTIGTNKKEEIVEEDEEDDERLLQIMLKM